VGQSDWLVFTPEGFFDGTRAAWNLVPFHFNSTPLKLYEPEQFFNEFFEPGLLAEIVTAASPFPNVLASRHDRRALLDISRYRDSNLPSVDINSSSVDPQNRIAVTITATDNGSGVKDCRVFRNHSLVYFEHGGFGLGVKQGVFSTTVALVAGNNVISSYCFNNDGLRSKEQELAVHSPSVPDVHPRAYIIAIGVDRYSNAAFNLNFAQGDAEDMALTLSSNLRSLGKYEPVLAALERLRGNMQVLPAEAPSSLSKIAAARPQDIVLFFFAGHGMGQGEDYYLLPHDVGYQGPRDHLSETDINTLQKHGVSDKELQDGFEGIDSDLSILVVDACESGKVLDANDPRPGPMNSRGLAQLAYDKGMYVLTAAQSQQAALEAGGKFGHGLLTYALVEEGLKTRRAYYRQQDAKLPLRQWFDYAVTRVPQLQAKLMRGAQARNWAVAIVNGQETVADPSKRSLQHPRVFYRRESDPTSVFVASIPSEHH
jgi:hypothetical protein